MNTTTQAWYIAGKLPHMTRFMRVGRGCLVNRNLFAIIYTTREAAEADLADITAHTPGFTGEVREWK